MKQERMKETEPGERVVRTMTAWGQRTEQVRALWLTGSFATGTADRFSDIDLRGCIESDEFDYFSSVEETLSSLDAFVVKRRPFSANRTDSEMVVNLGNGLCLDFHVVTLDRLKAAYLDPYPIRILFDRNCSLAELHALACREAKDCKPAEVESQVSLAVMAWAFLEYAIAATRRGKPAYALSLLEGVRSALARILAGRRKSIPDRFSPTFLPKFLPPEDWKILNATVPDAAVRLIPDTIRDLEAVLRGMSADLEKSDATGRLARERSSVESLIRREWSGHDDGGRKPAPSCDAKC